MAEGDSGKQDKYEARLTQAVDYLRGNVKWTLLAFGAIGTTLLAGSQLSNLGKFHYDEPRLVIALSCAVVALGMAAFAVWSALKVAYTGYVELHDLADEDIAYVERNPELLEGFHTVADLKSAYEASVTTRHEDFFSGETIDKLKSNENWYHYIDGLVDKVLSYVRYNKIRQQSQDSRTQLTWASVIAAIALVGFAWAANPPTEQGAVVLRAPPSQAKLALSEAGRTTLAPALGDKCVALASIDVIVLSVATAGSEVVTLASGDCPVARVMLTPAMGKLTAAGGAADALPSLVPSTTANGERPVIWTQLRPDTAGGAGELIARAIVPRDADCPALTVNGARWPMAMRTDGADPDFPIKMCEAALPGDAKAQLGDAALAPRPRALRRIVVIGDTGCRITDYAAQACDSAADWPFFRIAKAASAMHPDLVIHVGDYHYREKPCAGRAGCTGSPYGDNWRTWSAEFFAPAAPLLAAAPWLMLRGNHEDCTRAGAGWNLLIRPRLGLARGEACPADTDPGVFTFDRLRLVAPDTANAEGYGREKRTATYRKQIRTLAAQLGADAGDTWLVTHQALWVSYGLQDGRYDADEVFDRVPAGLDKALRQDLCQNLLNPMNAFREWFAGKIAKTAPDNESPCEETATASAPFEEKVPAPAISLVVSGDTHTFQMFLPDDGAAKKLPVQLVAGNGGDVLEAGNPYPNADRSLVPAAAKLFGASGKLWMRHTFGFAVLNTTDGTTWTATLYDVDGKAIAQCDLGQSTGNCKES